MKNTLAILLASTALAVGAGIPAWSAMQRVEHSPKSFQDNQFVRLAGDDDGDRESGRSYRSNDDGHRDGDDDDDDGGGDDDEDDDGSLPANGLFGSGAMPKVKVN